MRNSIISAFAGVAALVAFSAPAFAYDHDDWEHGRHHEHEWHEEHEEHEWHEGWHLGWYRPHPPVVRYYAPPPVAYYYPPVYYPAPAYSVTTFRLF